jgi:maltose alpha-D-glucosyltransferase/alpha-amylase
MMKYASRRPEDYEQLEPWARLWEQSASSAFLRRYREEMSGASVLPAQPAQFERLLEIYMLDKALYELVYELNNRPNWVRIPLTGILALPMGR